MGKGYNNYMCKKFFHPTNFDNIKRKWMAEQADEFETTREQEKLNQYRREQENLEHRVLLGDEKARLGLAWMYDQPVPTETEQQDKEVKFEWQRKFSAPRETYCKNSSEIVDQPFAIEVRNVRCMRCKQWGHLNTDRTCPLFGQSFTQEPTASTSLVVVEQIKKGLQKEGLALKRGSDLDRFASIVHKVKKSLNQGPSEKVTGEEDLLVMEFLQNLSEHQREKLLKKLSSTPGAKKTEHKHKHKHSKRK